MKALLKYTILLAWSSLAVALSCSRVDSEAVGQEPDDESGIRAVVERVGTKASVDRDDGLFTWGPRDRIALWTEENGFLGGDITGGVGTGSATFSVPLHGATRSGYAIFPEDAAYEGAPGTGGSPLAISLPTVRRIDNSGSDWNDLVEVPMVALNRPGQDLQFRYVCAVVRLTLRNVPSTTRFIRVMASRSISGYFVVDTTDPTAPFISSDNDLGGGNLSYMVFQFKSNVSGTVTVNLPVPGGVHYNLIVSTHGPDVHSSVVDALRPGAGDSRATSRFSIGEQRDFVRGQGYAYELDCSSGISYAMDSFTVPDVTLFESEQRDLSWYVYRNNAGNNLVTINDLNITSYVEDPTIARVQVIDRERLYYNENGDSRPIIRITGLKEGTTRLVSTAERIGNVQTDISTITVRKRGYHIFVKTGDKVLTGGRAPLTAIFRRDAFDTEADSYEWTITAGADLASIEDCGEGRYKWLRAGDDEGTVTLTCKAHFQGIVVESQPVSIRIMRDAPTGAVRGLFTVDREGNNVFFSSGNLLYETASDKYTFFDSQIGYYLHVSRPSGKPRTQVMTDLFDEFEIPMKWHDYPMNQTRVYSDLDSEDFTTGWYGPSYEEFLYIFDSRRGGTLGSVENARFAKCSVKDATGTNIRCVVLFPDGYEHPEGIPIPGGINTRANTSVFGSCIYTMSQMRTLEDAGVAFLPFTGTYESGSYQYHLAGGLYYTRTGGWNGNTEAGGRAIGIWNNEQIRDYTPGTRDNYFYNIRLIRRY